MKRPRSYLKDKVKEYLEDNVASRERKLRYRAIRHFLLPIYPEIDQMDKERMIDLLDTALNADRYFRLVQKANPHLQGSDYADGAELSDDAKDELGYHTHLPYK